MKFKVGDKVWGINENSCTNGFLGVITSVYKEALPYEVSFTNLTGSWPMEEGELELMDTKDVCVSCGEFLSYTSGEGCALMTLHKK